MQMDSNWKLMKDGNMPFLPIKSEKCPHKYSYLFLSDRLVRDMRQCCLNGSKSLSSPHRAVFVLIEKIATMWYVTG